MRLWGRRRFRLVGDDGSTIGEVMVATLVMAVAVLGVIGSMGAGMGLVGHSRQRSNGSGVAQERLERVRNVAYDDVAIKVDAANPAPAHNPSTGHPNNDITTDNARYRVDVNGTQIEEPLILSATGGLTHIDDPFTIGNTEFIVYQYVTWVDDPAVNPGTQDYKRVTVVVRWKFPVHSGPSHTVTMSTSISDGSITLPSATPTPTPAPATTATPPPSTCPLGGGGTGNDCDVGPLTFNLSTPPPTHTCGNDNSPPNITKAQSIAGGYVNSTAVQVLVEGNDPECTPMSLWMSNANERTNCNHLGQVSYSEVVTDLPSPTTTTLTWSVPPGDGVKGICVALRNARGTDTGRSRIWGFNVVLDETKPTVPGNFRKVTCTKSGNDRTVGLAWDASTDTNFVGYRVYRSIVNSPYNMIATTSSLSVTDTTLKSYDSVTYKVRAYDQASNESDDSIILSYPKHPNDC